MFRMWGAFRIGLFGAIASFLATAPAAAEPERLTSEAIQSTVAGAIVELDTPLGTKIPVKFSRDGLMAGEAGPLAGYLGAARDRGRWWVESNRLCMKWFRWFEAEPHCMSLRQQGDQIHWQEQSGRSGTARIAGRLDERPAMPTYAAAYAMPKVAKPPSTSQAAESRARQPARSSAIDAPPPASREGQRVEKARSPAPEPGPESTQPDTGAGVTTAGTPASPSRPERPQKPTRPSNASNAAPPLPVRSATRGSTPPDRDVRRMPSFSVVRVAHDDVLNVRVGPSEYHQRVGALPPNGRGVRIIGACRGLWCPVRYGRLSGWVNSYYLAAELPSASAIAEAR